MHCPIIVVSVFISVLIFILFEMKCIYFIHKTRDFMLKFGHE